MPITLKSQVTQCWGSSHPFPHPEHDGSHAGCRRGWMVSWFIVIYLGGKLGQMKISVYHKLQYTYKLAEPAIRYELEKRLRAVYL